MSNIKHNLIVTTLWAFCLLLFPPAGAQGFNLDIDAAFRERALSAHLEYIEDAAADAGVDAILRRTDWQESVQDVLNFGSSKKVYWIRFSLTNLNPNRTKLVIESANSFLDEIDFYIFDVQNNVLKQVRAGDHRVDSPSRIVHARNLALIALEPHQRVTVLLRVRSDSIVNVPLTVWNSDLYLAHDYQQTMWMSVYFGLLLALSIYHVILAIPLKDGTPLYYALFVLGFVVVSAAIEGLTTVVIKAPSAWLHDYMGIMAFTVTMVGSCLFTARILVLATTHLRLDRLLKLGAVLALVPSILVWLTSLSVVLIFCIVFVGLVLLVQACAVVMRLRDGYIPAQLLAGGLLLFAFVCGITIMRINGIGPSSAVLGMAPYAGTVAMMILYALSISHRIKLDHNLQEEARYKLLHELDMLVRERTDALEEVNKQLSVASVTDGLTQLYNRRYLDQMLIDEYNRAFRDRSSIALLILDIDHFKKINDTYGHPFGDHCLRTLASLMKQLIRRPADVVARYGGEEFVVLLPNTNLDGAIHIATKVNQALAAQIIDDGTQHTQATISVGVASVIPQERDQQQALLNQADAMLYRAKQNGRNRVEAESS